MKTIGSAAVSAVLALAAGVGVAHAQVGVLETDGDGSARLEARALAVGGPAPDVQVQVAADAPRQVWHGVGAALTDSAASVVAAMPPDARAALLHAMFAPGEGGFNLVRLTIGASDFSASGAYTYEDRPGDFDLSHDTRAIVPVLREIKAIRPGLRLLAAPWSPPAWMKTSGRLDGGAVARQAFPALADYLVRYARQYRDWGLPIWRLSPQNEPNLSRDDYPTALLPAAQEARFVGDDLVPALRQAGLGDVGVLGLDHNWSYLDYVRTLAASPAGDELAGYAFHCYAGAPQAMAQVRPLLRPGQAMLMTECSPTRGGGFGQGFRYTMTTLVMGVVKAGGGGVVMWNLALDPQGGPSSGGCQNCVGVATVAPSGAVAFDPSYYALAQVGARVRPGARVLEADTGSSDVAAIAFRNPDGGRVVVAYNAGHAPHRLGLRLGGQTVSYTLPPNAAATFTYTSGVHQP